jgi:hypothetical protein
LHQDQDFSGSGQHNLSTLFKKACTIIVALPDSVSNLHIKSILNKEAAVTAAGLT